MNKIVNGIVAVALVGVLAAGICCTGYASRADDGKWFKNSDLSTWHWSDKSEDKPEDKEPDDNDVEKNEASAYFLDGGLVVPEYVLDGDMMLMTARIAPLDYEFYDISNQVLSAFTITARAYDLAGHTSSFYNDFTFSVEWTDKLAEIEQDTETDIETDIETDTETDTETEIEPEEEQDPALDYGDVSQYVKMTTVTKSSVQFEVLQPFEHQITVTCTSNFNPEKSATTTVDYVQIPEIILIGGDGIVPQKMVPAVSDGGEFDIHLDNYDMYHDDTEPIYGDIDRYDSTWYFPFYFYDGVYTYAIGTVKDEFTVTNAVVSLSASAKNALVTKSSMSSTFLDTSSPHTYSAEEVTNGITIKTIIDDLEVFKNATTDDEKLTRMSALDGVTAIDVTLNGECKYRGSVSYTYHLIINVNPIRIGDVVTDTPEIVV